MKPQHVIKNRNYNTALGYILQASPSSELGLMLWVAVLGFLLEHV